MRCELDHIVIGAATLADGVRFIRETLGVEIPPGGRHPLMSTHNHLMQLSIIAKSGLPVFAKNDAQTKSLSRSFVGLPTQTCLGGGAFLEVISIDPDAPPPSRPRWYALDAPAMRARLAEGPGVIAWVVRSPDIVATAHAATYPVGEVIAARRDALSWRLTIPADGHIPGDGVLPHVIEWDDGARPWERMADLGCRLETLVISHPDPASVESQLRSIGADDIAGVEVKTGAMPGLGLRVVTPSGRVATL